MEANERAYVYRRGRLFRVSFLGFEFSRVFWREVSKDVFLAGVRGFFLNTSDKDIAAVVQGQARNVSGIEKTPLVYRGPRYFYCCTMRKED